MRWSASPRPCGRWLQSRRARSASPARGPQRDCLRGAARGARSRIRQELGLDASHLVVGIVANFNRPVKGGKYLVEAVPLVVRAVPAARFVVIGQGGGDELERIAAALGVSKHLIFAGFRENIADFLRSMDVSALTSLSEGLSITILESMGHGLPVVATAVGGNPEIVLDGQTGFLAPAKDPAAFAAHVIALLQDPALRRRMGEAGQRRIEEHFRIDKTAAEYLETYERLRGQRSEVGVPISDLRPPTSDLEVQRRSADDRSASSAVLHILAPAAVGGLESVVRMLAAGQLAAGQRVHVALIVDAEKPTFPWTETCGRPG